jgi:hypothetical protein
MLFCRDLEKKVLNEQRLIYVDIFYGLIMQLSYTRDICFSYIFLIILIAFSYVLCIKGAIHVLFLLSAPSLYICSKLQEIYLNLRLSFPSAFQFILDEYRLQIWRKEIKVRILISTSTYWRSWNDFSLEVLSGSLFYKAFCVLIPSPNSFSTKYFSTLVEY